MSFEILLFSLIHINSLRRGGGYLPQVLVATVKRTAKAVAVTSRDEER